MTWHIGESFAKLGRTEEAHGLLIEAVQIKLSYLGPNHYQIAHLYDALGRCCLHMNNREMARQWFQKAYDIRADRQSPNHALLDLSMSYLENVGAGMTNNALANYKLSKEQFFQLIRYATEYLHSVEADKVTFESNPTGFVRLRLPVPPEFKNILEIVRINFWAPTLRIQAVEVPHNHPRYFESMIIKGGYTHVCYKEHSDQSRVSHVVSRIFKSAHMERDIRPVITKNLCCLGPQSFVKGAHIAFPLSMIHQVTATMQGTMTVNCVFKDDENRTYYDVFMPIGGPQDPQVERIDLLNENAKVILQQMRENLRNWVENENLMMHVDKK